MCDRQRATLTVTCSCEVGGTGSAHTFSILLALERPRAALTLQCAMSRLMCGAHTEHLITSHPWPMGSRGRARTTTLLPQVYVSPLCSTTAVWLRPHAPPATALPSRAFTTVGVLRCARSPCPSCPFCTRGEAHR
jgi:hypothetical protein